MNDELLRYVAGALDATDEDAFEARLVEDEGLADEASRLLALRDMLRAMGARGPLVPVVTNEELRALTAHVKVTEHSPRDGAITTRITDEAFVAARIPMTTSAPRVHVVFCTRDGAPYFRVHEAPFDPASGELIVLCESHIALATGTLVVKVVDDADEVLAQVAIDNAR